MTGPWDGITPHEMKERLLDLLGRKADFATPVEGQPFTAVWKMGKVHVRPASTQKERPVGIAEFSAVLWHVQKHGHTNSQALHRLTVNSSYIRALLDEALDEP